MKKRVLPSLDEVIYAMSEEPLGMGAEAKVYKIHVEPDYTVRVSNNAPNLDILSQMIYEQGFTEQKDIFGGRNYAQPVAYMGADEDDKSRALVTINLYSPGFSMEIHKPGKEMPTSEVALMKTVALSKAVAEMPDKAFDKIYDDLHFLSAREYSIDVGGGGFFTNTGNILLSAQGEKEFRIIDIQPFIRQHVAINSKHTKGNNTPLCLAQGLIPGMYTYRKEHAKYPPLIDYRTEIIAKIIKGAQRNNLNDLDGYLSKTVIRERPRRFGGKIKEQVRVKVNMNDMANIWKVQMQQLLIPEKYIEGFIKDICAVKQEHRYRLVKHNMPLIRVSGRSMNS